MDKIQALCLAKKMLAVHVNGEVLIVGRTATHGYDLIGRFAA